MFLVFRAFFDPLHEDFFLCFRERVGGVRGRHLVVGVFREDARDEFALIRISGDDGSFCRCALKGVESEIGFALFLVESMAEKAILGEDGPHVPIV